MKCIIERNEYLTPCCPRQLTLSAKPAQLSAMWTGIAGFQASRAHRSRHSTRHNIPQKRQETMGADVTKGSSTYCINSDIPEALLKRGFQTSRLQAAAATYNVLLRNLLLADQLQGRSRKLCQYIMATCEPRLSWYG